MTEERLAEVLALVGLLIGFALGWYVRGIW